VSLHEVKRICEKSKHLAKAFCLRSRKTGLPTMLSRRQGEHGSTKEQAVFTAQENKAQPDVTNKQPLFGGSNILTPLVKAAEKGGESLAYSSCLHKIDCFLSGLPTTCR